MLKEGDIAPSFSLKDQNGKVHTLKDYTGQKIVLYFYPKDNTPGCTKEACAFRDIYEEYKKNNILVLGISKDTEKSHKNFAEKHNLPFNLLIDENRDILEKYGAWTKKSLYGKMFMGIQRITYVIDEKGHILKVYPKVKPEDHAKQILKDIGINT
ncbi:MAG: thioredoxin-dependent thiol peroxidase [Candidatus Woesearchaeota archaeon]